MRFIIECDTRICDTEAHVVSIWGTYVIIVSMRTFVSCIGEHERELYLEAITSEVGTPGGCATRNKIGTRNDLTGDGGAKTSRFIDDEFTHIAQTQ